MGILARQGTSEAQESDILDQQVLMGIQVVSEQMDTQAAKAQLVVLAEQLLTTFITMI